MTATGTLPPLAQQHQALWEFTLEDFREKTLMLVKVATDGMPQQWRKHARSVIKFFEEETTEATWAGLTQLEDPEVPGQSLAESWLQTWTRLDAVVGKPTDGSTSDADDTGPSAQDRTQGDASGAY